MLCVPVCPCLKGVGSIVSTLIKIIIYKSLLQHNKYKNWLTVPICSVLRTHDTGRIVRLEV